GVYVDASRLQYADVEAESFSLRGPAITPRSPQGLLPVLVADTDRAAVGEHVAGGTADGRVLDLDVSGGARPTQPPARLAAALRARDLVAPNPTPRRTLRARLGLPTAPFRPDPARRGDRARTSREESA